MVPWWELWPLSLSTMVWTKHGLRSHGREQQAHSTDIKWLSQQVSTPLIYPHVWQLLPRCHSHTHLTGKSVNMEHNTEDVHIPNVSAVHFATASDIYSLSLLIRNKTFLNSSVCRTDSVWSRWTSLLSHKMHWSLISQTKTAAFLRPTCSHTEIYRKQ